MSTYEAQKARKHALLAVVLGVLATLAALGIFIGHDGSAYAWSSAFEPLMQLRLPRVAAGWVVGGLLALSGMVLQILLRNPLADPYILGTSSGAALGAVLAIYGAGVWQLTAVVGLDVSANITVSLGAVVGALLAGAVLLLFAQRSAQALGGAQLLLTGVMLSAVLGALTTLVLTLLPDERLRGAVFWLMGDLSGAGYSLLAWCVLGVFLAFCVWQSPQMDRLTLGLIPAQLLGVSVARLRLQLLLGCCLATAAAVSLAGALGFVGLVVPQLLRLCGVQHTRPLTCWSVVAGGSLVVLADHAARLFAAPLELPVGAVMALLGAPCMVWFLWRSRV